MSDDRLRSVFRDMSEEAPAPHLTSDVIVAHGRRAVRRTRAARAASALAIVAVGLAGAGVAREALVLDTEERPLATQPHRDEQVPRGTSSPPGRSSPKGVGPQRCEELIRDRYGVPSSEIASPIRSFGLTVTVVLATRNRSWACEAHDVGAISAPVDIKRVKGADELTPEDFQLGNNPPIPVDRPTLWGGGPLPSWVRAVRFIFPDGGEQSARISKGFWVMQYHPEERLDGSDAPIKVEVSGADPRADPPGNTLVLQWGTNVCNRVTQSC